MYNGNQEGMNLVPMSGAHAHHQVYDASIANATQSLRTPGAVGSYPEDLVVAPYFNGPQARDHEGTPLTRVMSPRDDSDGQNLGMLVGFQCQ